MDYNELKEFAMSKKIEVKDIASELEMTPNGFRESIRNETIPLRKLKMLCTSLKINPMLFFDIVSGTFGNEPTQNVNSNKYQLENKDREIELLKQRITDKDEIIRLLRQVNSNVHGYNTAAEPK